MVDTLRDYETLAIATNALSTANVASGAASAAQTTASSAQGSVNALKQFASSAGTNSTVGAGTTSTVVGATTPITPPVGSSGNILVNWGLSGTGGVGLTQLTFKLQASVNGGAFADVQTSIPGGVPSGGVAASAQVSGGGSTIFAGNPGLTAAFRVQVTTLGGNFITTISEGGLTAICLPGGS